MVHGTRIAQNAKQKKKPPARQGVFARTIRVKLDKIKSFE